MKQMNSELYNEHGESDYEWTVGLNRYSLRALGVWPEDVGDPIWSNLYVILRISLILFGLILPQLYALVMVINNLSLVVENIFGNIAMITAASKLFLLWINKKQLATILASIRSDCFKRKENWERELTLAITGRARLLTISGYVLMFVTVVSLVIGPIFGLSFRVVNDITDGQGKVLPAQSYYPYDYQRSPYFELSFAFQIIAGMFASISLTSPALFFSAVVLHHSGQLAILNVKFKELVTSPNKNTIYVRQEFRKKLKDIVDTHTHIIRMVSKVENSFKNLILAQIFGISVVICCIGYMIANALDVSDTRTPIAQLIILCITFVTILMHTFVYCAAGENLLHYSGEIHHKIYETEWYSFHQKSTTDLLLIMIRAKDPLQLTAGKFIYLNLQSFTNILKTSAGYISMLIAVRDK